MTAFRLYLLPVSGGAFPIQIAFLTELYEAFKLNKGLFDNNSDYKPSLVMAASGGNVASYIGLGGDWNYPGMSRMINYLSSEMFVDSWLVKELNFIPTWAIGIFMGSIYRSGKGPLSVLQSIFNQHSIQDVEILTLTCNQEKSVPQIFSNRNKDTSLFQQTFSRRHTILYELMPLIFCNGNLEQISRVCMASAAVPMITQPQKIGYSTYADGGMVASSPFCLMSEALEDYLPDDQLLQTFLFAPSELDNEGDTSKFKVYGDSQFKITLLRMIHTQLLNERAHALKLIEKRAGKIMTLTTYRKANTQQLAEVLKNNENNHYLIMFYTDGCPTISLDSFISEDIFELIEKVKKEYNFDLWN